MSDVHDFMELDTNDWNVLLISLCIIPGLCYFISNGLGTGIFKF